MAETPEDRGPSSLRVVNFDAKNPIHQGIMASREVNHNIDVSKGKDNQKRIIMPVAPGMEAEPKQSTRYPSKDTHTEPYVYKEEKPAAKKAAPKKKAVTEPKKAEAPAPKTNAKPAPKKTAAPAGPVESGVKIKTDATLAAKAAAEKEAEKAAAEAKRKAERKRQLKEGHNPIKSVDWR